MLEAYFDESGTHERSKITAIGGFVASKDAWAQFERDLAAVLAPYANKGVSVFHMTDCLAQTGQFAFLEKPFINAILWGIGKALKRAEVTVIYAGVVQDDWDTEVLDGAFKARFPKPFDLCFATVLKELHRWSSHYGDGEPVASVFAQQDEYQGRMSAAVEALSCSGKYAPRLGSITFGRPENILPLQAADFAAYSMRGNIERRQYWDGIYGAGPTAVFSCATAGRYAHGGWYDAAALRLAMTRYDETGDI